MRCAVKISGEIQKIPNKGIKKAFVWAFVIQDYKLSYNFNRDVSKTCNKLLLHVVTCNT